MAAINVKTPKGVLEAKILAVTHCPKLGSPEESSKIQPTAATKAMHEIPSSKLLFGVIPMNFTYYKRFN
jgi:hypothetical protein